MNIEIIETDRNISSTVNEITINNESQTQLFYKKWRYVLTSIEKDLKNLHHSYTICGPFGFELLSNAEFAPKHIRKFYIYVNNPENKSIDPIAQLVEESALRNIALYYPEIHDDFVIRIRNQNVEFLSSTSAGFNSADKLLDIQVRDTQEPIAVDYGNYVILSYQAILNGVGEACNYQSSALHRSRMFQLAVMLFKLYNSYLPKATFNELYPIVEKTKPFINNSLTIFYKSYSKETSLITSQEKSLVDTYVLPLCYYIDKLLPELAKNVTNVNLSVESYHVPTTKLLKANIGKDMYNDLLNTVMDTYNNFCLA